MRAKGCLRYVHGFAPFHGGPEQSEDRRGRIARYPQGRRLRLYPRKTRIVKTREPAEGTGFALPRRNFWLRGKRSTAGTSHRRKR